MFETNTKIITGFRTAVVTRSPCATACAPVCAPVCAPRTRYVDRCQQVTNYRYVDIPEPYDVPVSARRSAPTETPKGCLGLILNPRRRRGGAGVLTPPEIFLLFLYWTEGSGRRGGPSLPPPPIPSGTHLYGVLRAPGPLQSSKMGKGPGLPN